MLALKDLAQRDLDSGQGPLGGPGTLPISRVTCHTGRDGKIRERALVAPADARASVVPEEQFRVPLSRSRIVKRSQRRRVAPHREDHPATASSQQPTRTTSSGEIAKT
jgi:hypothetical protein